MKTQEIWKDVIGYEGIYLVSNYGNIKSIYRNNKYLLLEKTYDGYLRAAFYRNGKKERFHVHRIVANAFIENKEYKKCVNHINSIRNDNRLENLEWVTHRENTHHHYNKKTKHIGISYAKRMNVYQVKIYVNNTRVYLGSYKTLEEAIKVNNNYKLKNQIK